MTGLCINPISANGQCYNLDHAGEVLDRLVTCFKYAFPALDAGRVELLYDPNIERRQLIAGQPLVATINALDPDSRKQWFVYIKNRSVLAGRPPIPVILSSSSTASQSASGEVDEAILQHERWLSFGGTPLNEAGQLEISGEAVAITVRNAHHVDSFKPLLPRYERSSKHRSTPYESDGESIAPMPLDDPTAQKLLLQSVLHSGDRWAWHLPDGQFYRFKPTRIEEDIYHGFQVPRSEVPHSIQKQLSQ